MKPSQSKSSLLSKYSDLYESNPRSKVFAPLAETYRKLGMFNEALTILRQGVKYHPDYVLAYIVLAKIYKTQKQYDLAFSTINSFVKSNLENITLQKLYADICVELNKLDLALETYKYLLLMNPRDEDAIQAIKKLEREVNPEVIINEEVINETRELDDDEWVQVNFHSTQMKVETEVESSSLDYEQWIETKPSNIEPLKNFKKEVRENTLSVTEHDLESDFFHEEYDNFSEEVIDAEEIESEEKEDSENRLISLGLVDLYIQQGHKDKAINLLEEILENNPADLEAQIKLKEFQISSKVIKENKEVVLESKLLSFLDKIKRKSHENFNN